MELQKGIYGTKIYILRLLLEKLLAFLDCTKYQTLKIVCKD